MTTPQPDSPEVENLAQQLHVWYLEATKELNPESYNPNAQKAYDDMTEEQKFIDRFIAAKLSEYYTNKFLEIVGLPQEHHPTCRSILVEPDDYCDCGILAVNEFKAELRQAIKQLSKRGK